MLVPSCSACIRAKIVAINYGADISATIRMIWLAKERRAGEAKATRWMLSQSWPFSGFEMRAGLADDNWPWPSCPRGVSALRHRVGRLARAAREAAGRSARIPRRRDVALMAATVARLARQGMPRKAAATDLCFRPRPRPKPTRSRSSLPAPDKGPPGPVEGRASRAGVRPYFGNRIRRKNADAFSMA